MQHTIGNLISTVMYIRKQRLFFNLKLFIRGIYFFGPITKMYQKLTKATADIFPTSCWACA